MYKELKRCSLVEIYNKYLPFNPRKTEGSSIGILIDQDNYDSFEVDVEGIDGHAGTNNGFIKSRWFVPRDAFKVPRDFKVQMKRESNYIEEVE